MSQNVKTYEEVNPTPTEDLPSAWDAIDWPNFVKPENITGSDGQVINEKSWMPLIIGITSAFVLVLIISGIVYCYFKFWRNKDKV